MTLLLSAVLAASTVKSVGAVIAVLSVIAVVVYAVVNIRSGRDEVASEIELAANRKPYYDDETMEGPRLERALSMGLVLLAVVAVGLPLYWLNEPGRQDGAVENFDSTFVKRGAALFAPTADGGYDCAGCHASEGVGGIAPFTLTDDEGEFVATVTWQAPALDTVLLRYSEEEVRYILVYGRPGTPMPAWGEEGGGPLTTQQIDELIAYIKSIQISADEAREQVAGQLRTVLGLEEGAEIDYSDPAVGEALFNLGIEQPFAGGAYSCARCHTKGASFISGEIKPEDADISAHAGFEDGSGAFGFSLTEAIIPRQFLSLEDLVEFVSKGSEDGMLYGQRGQGSGRMPGFGDNPNTEDEEDGMFTQDMVKAVACYEATLSGDRVAGCRTPIPASDDEATTTTTTAASDATTTTTTEEP
ncbi:MAG TPA: cytochrome c [Acidimicrobiales bacterium]